MYKKLVLASIILLIITSLNCVGIKGISIEEKKYSYATIEDDFAEDRIIVILKEDASKEFLRYNNDSFSEIDCEKIEILNKEKGEFRKREF